MTMITLFLLQLSCFVWTVGPLPFSQQTVLQQMKEKATHSTEKTVNKIRYFIQKLVRNQKDYLLCSEQLWKKVFSSFLVHGGWSGWGGWSGCSVTCGSGFRSRSRSCNSPARQYGGNRCSGSSTENSTRGTHSCPSELTLNLLLLLFYSSIKISKTFHFPSSCLLLRS